MNDHQRLAVADLMSGIIHLRSQGMSDGEILAAINEHAKRIGAITLDLQDGLLRAAVNLLLTTMERTSTQRLAIEQEHADQMRNTIDEIRKQLFAGGMQ